MSLVSVIIPCFNQGEFLSEAIESIVAQTHQDWECIIVNDGSTDNTYEIAHHWINTDSRIKCLSKNNGGLSSARNEGIRLAKGEYLQFLDADDFIQPEKFALQLNALKQEPACTVAVCDHLPFDHLSRHYLPRFYKSPFLNETNYKEEILSEWEFRKSIPCHSFLIPKKLIDQHNLLFDESLPNHEDWVFWCEMLYYAPGISYQKEKFSHYRMRPNSLATNKKKMAEGFLRATYILENFYLHQRASRHVSLVQGLRKEIKNNLFPYSTGKKIYSAIVREAKNLLGIAS